MDSGYLINADRLALLTKTPLRIVKMDQDMVEYQGMFREAVIFGKWWRIILQTPAEVGQLCMDNEPLENLVDHFENFKIIIRQTGIFDQFYHNTDYNILTTVRDKSVPEIKIKIGSRIVYYDVIKC